MKHLIFITILVFTFCFGVFAQNNESQCPKINIKTPETAPPNETFQVSASFDKESQPLTFNWTIIKANEVTKINKAETIKIDTKNYNDKEPIVILATSSDEKCRDTAMAKIFVVPTCWLARKIAEYGKVDRNVERAQLDILISEIEDKVKGVIFLNFDKKSSVSVITNRLKNIYNDLFVIRKIDKTRIEFAISRADEEITELKIFPQDFENICEDCLIIKAKDLEKIENLFQPKTIVKNR